MSTSRFRERFYKATHEKHSIQRKLSRKVLFRLGEFFGFHVVGDHFYEPSPNLKLVKQTHDDSVREIPGVRFDLDSLGAAHISRL